MDEYIGKHPLELQDYTIPTQGIEMMANTLYQWIDIMLPGGFIYGHPRVGKTSAIEYLIPEIPNIFNANIPAFMYLCSEKPIVSEGRFYEELLNMVEHALSKNGPTEQKRQRFINFWLSLRVNKKNTVYYSLLTKLNNLRSCIIIG